MPFFTFLFTFCSHFFKLSTPVRVARRSQHPQIVPKGYFLDEEQAARRYDEAASKLGLPLNFPPKGQKAAMKGNRGKRRKRRGRGGDDGDDDGGGGGGTSGNYKKRAKRAAAAASATRAARFRLEPPRDWAEAITQAADAVHRITGAAHGTEA